MEIGESVPAQSQPRAAADRVAGCSPPGPLLLAPPPAPGPAPCKAVMDRQTHGALWAEPHRTRTRHTAEAEAACLSAQTPASCAVSMWLPPRPCFGDNRILERQTLASLSTSQEPTMTRPLAWAWRTHTTPCAHVSGCPAVTVGVGRGGASSVPETPSYPGPTPTGPCLTLQRPSRGHGGQPGPPPSKTAASCQEDMGPKRRRRTHARRAMWGRGDGQPSTGQGGRLRQAFPPGPRGRPADTAVSGICRLTRSRCPRSSGRSSRSPAHTR